MSRNLSNAIRSWWISVVLIRISSRITFLPNIFAHLHRSLREFCQLIENLCQTRLHTAYVRWSVPVLVFFDFSVCFVGLGLTRVPCLARLFQLVPDSASQVSQEGFDSITDFFRWQRFDPSWPVPTEDEDGWCQGASWGGEDPSSFSFPWLENAVLQPAVESFHVRCVAVDPVGKA